MSTREAIVGRKEADGSVAFICIYDENEKGAPYQRLESTLLRHWKSAKKVEDLMRLGDLAWLGEQAGEKHDFATHHFLSREPLVKNEAAARWCLALGRDRGDLGERVKSVKDEEAFADLIFHHGWGQMAYLYKDGGWTLQSREFRASSFLPPKAMHAHIEREANRYAYLD